MKISGTSPTAQAILISPLKFSEQVTSPEREQGSTLVKQGASRVDHYDLI